MYTVTGGGNSGTNLNRERAVWNGQNPYGGTACGVVSTACKSYLDPTKFSTNPSYTVNLPLSYGNVVKGSFVGPQYTDWDVSVMRYFPVDEGLQFQFRAEYFNVLNHTNFGVPGVTFGGGFGQIVSTAEARIIQFALKLRR